MPHSGKSLLGALSAPVYWLYRLWCRSLRYTEINRAAIENAADQGRPVVLSLWHDELFPLIYLKRRARRAELRWSARATTATSPPPGCWNAWALTAAGAPAPGAG